MKATPYQSTVSQCKAAPASGGPHSCYSRPQIEASQIGQVRGFEGIFVGVDCASPSHGFIRCCGWARWFQGGRIFVEDVAEIFGRPQSRLIEITQSSSQPCKNDQNDTNENMDRRVS